MDRIMTPEEQPTTPDFLSGGGEMGERLRAFDWSATSLGPVSTWPQSLRTCIRIMLASRQPIWIGWGKDLIKFYNDPYISIVGGKHPAALGQPASVVWKDIWKDIEGMLTQVMDNDQGTYVESQLLIMERNGYPEETYYTFSYTPIPGDNGGTEGMICANTEDTERIVSERQLLTLTTLANGLGNCTTEQELFEGTVAQLKENQHDFPFALFYELKNGIASLKAASCEIDECDFPDVVELSKGGELGHAFSQACQHHKRQTVSNLPGLFLKLPFGAWSHSPSQSAVLPVVKPGDQNPCALLVVALNPYRLTNEKYLSFLDLIADQVTTSFAKVYNIEQERKRRRALEELDLAKTTFFSNISHEFRTPLSLILGPIEETLSDNSIGKDNTYRMAVARRNALRMQKLVNTLLEFSRIEAGRLHGNFVRTDIGLFTQDLASAFRSAVEKAGMKLIVEIKPIPSQVYVDPEMWEKIVLNLISNAFKYSSDGSITVQVKEEDGFVVFSVTDTGIGIPADQLEKVFDRFHRITSSGGRSQEGTGIGLAMVKELVKIHHGTVVAKSQLNKGTTFTVRFPVGKEHLPLDKIVDDSSRSETLSQTNAYLEEAMRWIPDQEADSLQHPEFEIVLDKNKATVLLADDNSDMREYVGRILRDEFNVITATDGEKAFQLAATHRPDLVLSDIMMPNLDGFGLLKKLRANTVTQSIPVIFLSARAGEEAKVEGLDAGADDYLVKPFSARELMVRVSNRIKINEVRKKTEEQFFQLFRLAPAFIHLLRGPDHVFEFFHPKAIELLGRDLTGESIRQLFPGEDDARFVSQLDAAYATGEPLVINEMKYERRTENESQQLFFDVLYKPFENDRGQVEGMLYFAVDVTEKVIARRKIQESEANLAEMIDTVPAVIWITDENGMCTFLNRNWYQLTNQKHEEALGMGWLDATHPDDKERTSHLFAVAMEHQRPFSATYRLRHHTGEYRWVIDNGAPRYDQNGNFIGMIGTVVDVHEEERIKEALHESREMFSAVAEFAFLGIFMADLEGNYLYTNDAFCGICGYTTEELKSLNIRDLTFPEDVTTNVNEQVQLVDGAIPGYSSVQRLIKKGGETVWVQTHGSLVKDKEQQGIAMMGVCQDITEKLRIETELKASEEYFNELASAMPQLVWVAGADGRVMYYNNRINEFEGISKNDDATYTWGPMLHDDDLPVTSKLWEEARKSGTMYEAKHRVKMKDGSYKWHLSRAFPQRDAEGQIVKWFGTATEIQSFKEQEQLLEQQVKARTQELQWLNKSLQQSNEDLQQFAHVASHDLKEPLRKIKIFSGRVEEDPETKLSPQSKAFLAKVKSATARMNQMIEGVLSYSTFNSIDDRREPLNMNQLIREILDDLEIMVVQKQANVVYDNLHEINGSAVLIYQLFYNLLNNSLKFSRTDERLEIILTSEEIEVEGSPHVRFVMRDNGIGFDQKDAAILFHTFSRLNSKDAYEGTGLGLALCKKIVERHNGTIEADGIRNEGAVFTVTLPK
ncbi:MAG: PAS domain S-box protein [Chitinophagaceae bacterium]|nr:PAS domain S-box protein [Chitinophagaceae bacterium]